MPSDRFLNRWSRMKAKSRPQRVALAEAEDVDRPEHGIAPDMPIPEVEIVEGAVSEQTTAPRKDSAPEELMDEDAIAAKAEELGLPALDTLGPGSDFKGFMAKDVPDQLRNLALRRLWRSNPILANLDGLNVYEEDYSDAAKVIPNMQSAYQVGRGYLRDPEPDILSETSVEVADADSSLSEAEHPNGEPEADGGESDVVESEKTERNPDVAVQQKEDEETDIDELGVDSDQQIGHT